MRLTDLLFTIGLLYTTTQDQQWRGGTVRRGLGPPTAIIKQENTPPQACLQANLREASS